MGLISAIMKSWNAFPQVKKKKQNWEKIHEISAEMGHFSKQLCVNIVLTSLNWFDCIVPKLWCLFTFEVNKHMFFQKCQFKVLAYFCIFNFVGGFLIAGDIRRSVCRLPEAMDITGKMPCIVESYYDNTSKTGLTTY